LRHGLGPRWVGPFGEGEQRIGAGEPRERAVHIIRGQPALGLFENAAYETSTAQLAPRDVVLLFTDGLYEVHTPANELYTHALLVEAVQKRTRLPVSQLFDDLLEEIKEFSQGTGFTDDVCLVALEVAGKPPQ